MSRIHAALRKADVRDDAPFILDPPPPAKLVLVPAKRPVPAEEDAVQEKAKDESAPEPSDSPRLSGMFKRFASVLSR
jgi:hypothetical protein